MGGQSTKRLDYERKFQNFTDVSTDFWVTVKGMKIDEDSRKRVDKALKKYNPQSL